MKTIKHITGTTVATLLFTFSSCSEIDESVPTDSSKRTTVDMVNENDNNPDESVFRNNIRNHTAYLYTQSNDSGSNTIYCYKRVGNESLTFMGSVASGGRGNDLTLGSHGAVVLDNYNEYLYAVNAGSNSISSFEVKTDGTLLLKQTIASGGRTPISLSVYKDYLYVLNSGSSTTNGFVLGHNGTFVPIEGSEKELSSNTANAAQIRFSPHGNYIYITEKATNTITMFVVNDSGLAGERISVPSIGRTPFGFAFARDEYMIVSNAEMNMTNRSSVTSYLDIETSHLASMNGALTSRQTGGCGVAITVNGRFAFVTNSRTNSITAYYISPAGNLYKTDTETICGDTPTDIVVASDNYTIYVLCEKDDTIHQYIRTARGGLLHIGELTGIPTNAVGLATW